MAEDYDDDDQQTDGGRGLRAQLEAALAKAKDNDELRNENQRLKNDGVIRDAGLTLNDRQKAALQATHEGNWTPEAIKTTATELGFIQPPVTEPVVDDPSLALHDQIAQASAGTDAPPTSTEAQIDASLAKATTEAEYLAIYRASGRALAQ